MRRLSTCFCSLIALIWLAAMAQVTGAAPAESFPYEARVVMAGATVRSGPGESFYPTDSLAEGDAVEVYQGRPDGWCAIRPPETSFSWVFARHVVPVGDGLARIDKDDVPARVGSSLSSQRNVTQVELREGEIVRVIDEETHDGQTWYKIAPPAGEFRWIHASHIRHDGAAFHDANEADAAWRPLARSNQQSLETAANSGNDTVHLASTISESAPAGEPDSPTAVRSTNAPLTAKLPEDFGRRVADLELRLSRMIAEPTSTWDVGELKGDAEQLLTQAESGDERDAVQASLAKIDRFATIQRRYAQSNGSATPSIQELATTPIGASNGSQTIEAVGAQTDETGRFDAVGILRPVVSRRPGAPQFALVDDRGQVVSFVTPSPDVNLQPYLGRRVGVVGMRGFMPEFRRNHVVAGRVSPLENNLVR